MDKQYAEIIEAVNKCRDCELGSTRKNAVPGEGNIKSVLMFIGEGPGADEDEQGRPFVGRAGQLLTKILESVNISREEVYITNVVKCRPPNNRVPQTAEADACKKHLFKQIALIKPKFIGTLGSTASKFLLGDDIGTISKIRGNWYDFGEGIKLMPLFHPSYLLRNPSKEPGAPKHHMYNDMKKLKDAYDAAK